MRVPSDAHPSLYQGRTRREDGPCTDQLVLERGELAPVAPGPERTWRARECRPSKKARGAQPHRLDLVTAREAGGEVGGAGKEIVSGECFHSPDIRGNLNR